MLRIWNNYNELNLNILDEWGREGVKSHRESHAVDAVQVEGKLSSNALTNK